MSEFKNDRCWWVSSSGEENDGIVCGGAGKNLVLINMCNNFGVEKLVYIFQVFSAESI